MPQSGSNLLDFRAAQLEFAAHIRNPDEHPIPSKIEPRRMKIYVELFYNNIENFLASGFPIARKILLARGVWHDLVRDFVHHHASSSPYFLEISQEFLSFLGVQDSAELPDFLLELCHYEWVELALSVSEIDLGGLDVDSDAELLDGPIVISPLIWKLAYRYPVHLIGEKFQPEQPPDERTYLIVNRRRDDRVSFLATNALTVRLLDILAEQPMVDAALAELAAEFVDLDAEVVHNKGIETLRQLRDAEIVLGVEKGR